MTYTHDMKAVLAGCRMALIGTGCTNSYLVSTV